MAAVYKALRTARRKFLATIFLVIFFTIFILPTNVPSEMGAFRVINTKKLQEVGRCSFNHNKCLQEREGKSSSTSTEVPVNSGEDEKKIARLVHRILEVEKSLVKLSYISPGVGLDTRQLSQLELLAKQMKLVKSLLEKSVYMMKLANIASHGRDSSFSQGMESSSWIAWDHLEPATRDLENDVKSLQVGEETGRTGYSTKQRLVAISFVVTIIMVLLIGLVLYAIKLTWFVRTRSIKSTV